jgi:excisionase family DNA binding protein
MSDTIPVQIEPLLISAEDAARLLGISRSKFYELYNSGRLGVLPIKLGRRSLWRVSELREWVESGCKPRG